jgi:hypothetical protein
MKVELFVLCDAAADYNGKLNILGTFDTIWAKQIPAVHRQCAIALRARFSRIEEGDHMVKIHIVDEDGKAVVPSLEAGVHVQFGETPSSVSMNMIFNIQGLTINDYGEYSIDLAIDGRHEASLPLYMNRMQGNPD